MSLKGRNKIISLKNTPRLAIFLVLLIFLGTDFSHHNWTRDKGPDRGVIKWDIISYYAYLPATFIYGDVALGFLDEGIITNDNKFWAYQTETGKKLIVTSMGLSIMYSPFFFMAHLLAPVFGEPRDGFSSIYQFFLVFGAFFYVAWGLHFLRLILRRYFPPLVTAFTIIAIGLGTNLYNYATFDAPMSHSFSFALIILLLYLTIKWYERPGILKAVGIGALMGLITLIRPSNLLVLLVFLLWGITSWAHLKDRFLFYIQNLQYVLIMAACFLIAWIPQFLYWKLVTGEFIYNSYGPHGGAFYFAHPHIMDILFSYRKGWFLYTPLILFAIGGLIPMYRSFRIAFWSIILYLPLMVYLQASWWSWWFGGGFGSRVFIDIYGILAIPMAASIHWALQNGKRIIRYSIPAFMGLLIIFQVYQTRQYVNGAIHSLGMTRETYWLSFLRMNPRAGYWQALSMPDPVLNRLGIYVFYLTGEDNTELKKVGKEEGIQLQLEAIRNDAVLMKDIRRYSKRESVPLDQAIHMVAERMYEQKTNGVL